MHIQEFYQYRFVVDDRDAYMKIQMIIFCEFLFFFIIIVHLNDENYMRVKILQNNFFP